MSLCFSRVARAACPVLLAFLAGWVARDAAGPSEPLPSQVVTQAAAASAQHDWGELRTYFEGETFGTKDLLGAVAVIKPGQQIHPPHQHAEEEFMMVIEGAGEWHVRGEAFEAVAGDILYAAPWDVHGIRNTGTEPLRFVVFKWNSQGVEPPLQPAGGTGE